MAKIESVKDLPEWFDLEKYKDCESFGAIEWLDQLSRRADIFQSYVSWLDDHSTPENRGLNLSMWRDWNAAKFEDIQTEPVKQRNAEFLKHRDSQPIGTVGILDLFLQQDRDKTGAANELCPDEKYARWGALYESPKCDPSTAKAVQSNPIYLEAYPPIRLPQAVIRVDLGATDAVLRKSFDLWLAQARAELKAKAQTPINPIYGKWARYGLLPYLDLKIWAMYTEDKIPDRVMSAATSHYDKGESSFRKTVPPLAESLMQDLSALGALAAIEAARLTNEGPETFDD